MTAHIQSYKVQVLDRAIALLQLLSTDGSGLTLAELSRKLKMHRSTIYRLLRVLERHRLVVKSSREGAYCLGFRFFELASRVMEKLDLRARARPYLERLVAETGETAHLCILDQGAVLYLEKVEAPKTVRAPSVVGGRYPVHCGAAGKALLAYLPEEQLDKLIRAQGLPAHTHNTITTSAQLKMELRNIRERGYSVDNEEYEEGLRCIGAPIRDFTRKVIAAVSVAGPAFRLTEQVIALLGPAVLSVAREFSTELGYTESEANPLSPPAPRRGGK